MRSSEFPNDLRWLNSPPLAMKELRDGHAVLLDFWTYTSADCLRTLAHLKEWHKKYAKFGLVVVGVHTPEFEFEKNVENVTRAVKEFGIEYPVVMDNDYRAWSMYDNETRPHVFLVSKDGQIIYDHAGEGNYTETEDAIRMALLDANGNSELPSAASGEMRSPAAGGTCTPETYLGTMRGRPGRVWNFSGEWKMFQEYIEHEEMSEKFSDCLTLNFSAAEVNLVMGYDGERPAKVRLELGGSAALAASGKLPREIAVREEKIYNLFRGEKYMRGTLKVFVKDKGLRAYAFSFGGCV